MSSYSIINADVIDGLAQLDDGSVQTCVTSPPYWGLRDYGVEGQIGLEKTPEEYVERMVRVLREVRRVLKDDGTLWLNLGDSYASFRDSMCVPQTISGEQRSMPTFGASNRGAAAFASSAIKHKDIVGIPWRVAFALQADGWYLRQDIIWHKPNPMPESVRDRCTKAHEYIFLLSKQARYYYDQDACREKTGNEISEEEYAKLDGQRHFHEHDLTQGMMQYNPEFKSATQPLGRNKRSVWTVPTQSYSEAHFATFPPKLIEPCILAGCPEGGTVLDPFCGSGTTGMVALRHVRQFVGIELNAEYVDMAHRRIQGDMPLLNAQCGHHIGDANEMVEENE